MSRMSFAKRLAVMLTVGGFLLGTAGNSYGASRVNLDRNDTVYNNVSEYFEPVKSDYQYQDDAVKIGYIVTGDKDTLLDDITAGYIRRMINAKFPGVRYPTKKINDIEGKGYTLGRRNFGEKYIVTEAHDIQNKELEYLENEYDKRISGESVGTDGQAVTIVNVNNVDTGNTDPLGKGIYYDYSKHFSTLPKDAYVRFARELQASGRSDYDYLLMFDIRYLDGKHKKNLFGSTETRDFKISVRAIDMNTGEYIDRAEYVKRGYSHGNMFSAPSWRLGMRRAIVDGMIESFDHMPIGKYSVCDNPYCPRRQEELRTQEVFGKINRHCIKHCYDKTQCYEHMVDWKEDADLPDGYVNYNHDRID